MARSTDSPTHLSERVRGLERTENFALKGGAFLPVVAPASIEGINNRHYASAEDFLFAMAEVRIEALNRALAGRKIAPGVIGHATNVVEHPELIAMRLTNFAGLVGREDVIGRTDCGFSQGWNSPRAHAQTDLSKAAALK